MARSRGVEPSSQPETTPDSVLRGPENAALAYGAALMTAEQVAAILAVPPSWVLRQAREGRIPHVTLGRYVRFRPASIAAWVAEQEAGGR